MPFEDLHRPLSAAGFKGAVKWIIIISGVMLMLQQVMGKMLIDHLGLVPTAVFQHYWLWQPITYLFLHGSLFHWLFNMFILWMFGRELETRWGTPDFLKYFFVTGLGAAVCVLLISPHSSAPTIGSSGAVFGMLVAFAMVFPEATMYLYFVIPVKAWQAAALFAFIEFFAALEGGGVGIARFAHLGGMLTGYLYLRYGALLSIPWSPVKSTEDWFKRITQPKPKPPVEFHELTDELAMQVDKILDKILKKGVDSLTRDEKKLMDRYSKLKK
jgi:membrane associated rhomboid family serine protease